MKLKIGSKAPDFNLPGADGKSYTLDSFKDKAILAIVFSCNHCPYVQAYESRMMDIQRDYADRDTQLVAINSNETKNYPEDSFEKMARRAKEKRYNFPYLRDEDQSVAHAYDAACTPEFFVFDKKRQLQYHGRLDDNHENPAQVTKRYLRDAFEALLMGKMPPLQEVHPIGCSIKWSR
ncbi:MAG: thioredoxin family protein [Deltaproteobacteria bacterium]|nr:thioredoxin family protein [Deltaproteobacteria bacterium]